MILQLELEQLRKELLSKGTDRANDAAYIITKALDELRDRNCEIDRKVDYISELNIEYSRLLIENTQLKATLLAKDELINELSD